MSKFNPGTYLGSARGYVGLITVALTVSEDEMLAIRVKSHTETKGIGWGLPTSPVEAIPPQIIKYQSLNIPAVNGSGATSKAIKNAVIAALTEAGASEETLDRLKEAPGPAPETHEDGEEITVDVLICGAGGAGLAAGIEAAQSGAKVLIVEKQGITGGSTARSGGKLLGAGTRWQKAAGIEDSPDMTFNYLMEVGNRHGNFMDPKKVRYFCDHANETIEWINSLGCIIHDVEPIHESIIPWRIHNVIGGGRQSNGFGGEITVPLTTKYMELGGEILYNTAMKELTTDDEGAVTGCVCQRKDGSELIIKATQGVILATGGYAFNRAMCSRYPIKNFYTLVPKSNTGDGLKAAEKLGARNYEHPSIQVLYAGLSNGVGIDNESGLIVNRKGKRVTNEWAYQFAVGDAILYSGSNIGWYITTGDEPYFQVQRGYSQSLSGASHDPHAPTIEKLASMIECPALVKTVERYNELAKKRRDDDFFKPSQFMLPIKGTDYVALRLRPTVSVTYGGLEIDAKARVLDKNGHVIQNLYACGEVAGTGLYGTQYPACGTSIGYALFFGRVAGRRATSQPAL